MTSAPRLLVGCDCDNFRTLLFKVEDIKYVFAVTINQQHKDEDEDIDLDQLQQFGDNPTPLLDLLGEEYDFPQTNISVQAMLIG